MSSLDLEQSLIADIPRLSPDEQKFMRQVFDRVLVVGRRNYSPWQMHGDSRSMLGEAKEELLDAVVYLAMETAQLEAKRARVTAFISAHDSDPFDDSPTSEFPRSVESNGSTFCQGGEMVAAPPYREVPNNGRLDFSAEEPIVSVGLAGSSPAPDTFSCSDCGGTADEHRSSCPWVTVVPGKEAV